MCLSPAHSRRLVSLEPNPTADPPSMARQPPSTPSNASLNSTSGFPYVQPSGSTSIWDPVAATTSHRRSLQSTPPSMAARSSHNTYLMPASPAKGRRASVDYRPSIKKALGNVPACLVNASVTYCGNDQIYAFGGFDQFTDEVYNHVLRLNLNTLTWDLVDNYGDIPGVRMGHTASLWQGTKLLVFGGENEHREYLSDIVILDIPTSTWTQPDVRGAVPRGRARHASVIYEDKLFVIGGLTGESNAPLDDLCYLDLKTWTWSRTWSFIPRFDHTAWVWGGRLWVFGGLGPEMDRSTDLWWLDLKGSPSLDVPLSQDIDEPQGSLHRVMTPSPGVLTSPPQLSSRSGGYAANSASVQIRSLARRKPTAPGAISSLSFHSGPHVPSLLSGTHFHVYSSGVLLDLITPSETVRPYDCNLSSLELDSLRWQRLADGQEVFRSGYRWHYCTINEDGTKVWLLGCNVENITTAGDDNQLNEVLCLDLEKYGLLGNDFFPESSEQSRILASERQRSPQHGGLGADLLAVFDQPPETGSGTDFTITAECDDINIEDDISQANSPPPLGPSRLDSAFLSPTAKTSTPIHVHRIILQARWPHFKRLYSAQMAEFHTKRMHIPEPYSVVRAFLYYLYSDSIQNHPEFCASIFDVAGMLVMANLYDMPKLRLLCVHRLSRELDVENAAIIWERAGRTNEEWLRRRAAQFCLSHWGRVVRTAGFKSLNRQSLIDLCEVVDTEARIIAGPELEIVGALGSGSLASSSKQRRLNRNSLADDMDDIEGEEEDGMEL